MSISFSSIYFVRLILHPKTINFSLAKGVFICERSRAYLNIQMEKTWNPRIVIVKTNMEVKKAGQKHLTVLVKSISVVNRR